MKRIAIMFAGLLLLSQAAQGVEPGLAPVSRTAPAHPTPVAGETRFDAIVSADGSGTHATVQAAVEAAPANATVPFVILLKPGTYTEHIVIPADRPPITFHGQAEEAHNTVIAGGLNLKTPGSDGKALSARDSATVLVQAADFTAENLTFENTTTREDRVQALAMYVEADRAVFRKCRFLGWQDTLRADAPRGRIGRQYFADCYVEGHVDFIYAAGTAVFDRCHIHVKADGYITAASTPETTPFGFVFLDCTITAGPAVEKGFYLGRPWRPFAATSFLRCQLPAGVLPAGWHNWRREENEQTARYAEYKSTGAGANPADRVKWARQLTATEAEEYTVETILKGEDSWNPAE